MIYFIYGEDSYRSKRKLEEIIEGYKKVHKSGLNLIYVNAKEKFFKDFYSNFKITSMFAEKKLIIINNLFDDAAPVGGQAKFQEDFLENVESIEKLKDIVVVYENCAVDQRTKIFKALQKFTKCQEFNCLQPAMLKKWAAEEFEKNNVKINSDALDVLVNFVGNDLWKMANEINKLSNYTKTVNKKDVELLVKPNIENEIFKTIDALAVKDKKQALALLRRHLEGGDNILYLLSMICYQFRNLLIVRELMDARVPYQAIAKKSGLHPFVAQKTYYACNQFTFLQLKKIYQKIFKVDSDIKTGKVEPELALDLLLAEI